MATAAIGGQNGSLVAVAGTGAIPGTSEISEWTLDTTMEALDATSFDSAGWREFAEGLMGATGTFAAKADNAIVGSVTLTLDISSTPGDLRFTCAAIVTASNTSTPVDGLVSYSGTFTVTGAVTIGTVPV